jgi:DNA-directed RNA polymerase specialized sigma24 family protein
MTAKRGGGFSFVSIDAQTGEEQFLEGMSRSLTGEQQFDRQWAATVLLQAKARLQQECDASGRSGLYERVSLVDGENSLPYAAVAQELGMSVSAVKSAVSRLRQRYGQLVREEVGRTVSSPEEIPEEIRHLLTVMGT